MFEIDSLTDCKVRWEKSSCAWHKCVGVQLLLRHPQDLTYCFSRWNLPALESIVWASHETNFRTHSLRLWLAKRFHNNFYRPHYVTGNWKFYEQNLRSKESELACKESNCDGKAESVSHNLENTFCRRNCSAFALHSFVCADCVSTQQNADFPELYKVCLRLWNDFRWRKLVFIGLTTLSLTSVIESFSTLGGSFLSKALQWTLKFSQSVWKSS